MHKALLFLILIAFLTSCHHTPKPPTKLFNFGLFTMVAPKTWTFLRTNGFDAYVGRIAIDSNDTLSFELSKYADNLAEYQPIKMDDGKTYFVSAYDSSANLTLFDSTNLNQIIKSNINWDTIDGRRAKILSPIAPGIGTTGLYIDSLWGTGDAVTHFNLYGTDLSSDNEKAVLTAFHTLTFHNRNSH